MRHPMIHQAAAAAAVALVTLLPAPVAAQKGALPPTNVTADATATGVSVAWTPVRAKGVMYRVLRSPDPRERGVDVTREPLDAAMFEDVKVDAGATYFYQVVAMFDDGTSAAATPVSVTVPAAPVTSIAASRAASVSLKGQPVVMAPGSAPRSPLATPTAVTGIVVNGTLASAVVSWLPVTGAVGYSIKRKEPASGYSAPPSQFGGLAATPPWTDTGPGHVGFVLPGVYRYDVTADLGGGASVTGQANWTRPDPTCAAPPASQPLLAVLDTKGSGPAHFLSIGPFPNGAAFTWSNLGGVAAYRVERSMQGTNGWTLVGTSCGATPSVVGWWGNGMSMRFVDGSAGITPNTAYVYRLTTLAANGEAGMSTIPWNAPNPPVLHWLSATAVGSTVTLHWRYEPPTISPPALPLFHRVTALYGFTHVSYLSCASLAGCSLVINSVPSGTHQFTVTAGWSLTSANSTPGALAAALAAPIASMSAVTVVTVP